MTVMERQLPPSPSSAPAHRRKAAARVRPKPLHVGLAAFLYLFFALLLGWPIFQIIKTGFTSPDGGFTLRYIALIFQDPVLTRGLWNAAWIAILVTLLTAAISLPLAVLSV